MTRRRDRVAGPVESAVGEARDVLDRLRMSWRWLRLLAEPGRETHTGRVLTDAQRAARDATAAQERAERFTAPRPDRTVGDDLVSRASLVGVGALASTSAPVRLGVVLDAARVRAKVVTAVKLLRDAGVAHRGDRALLEWLGGSAPAPWVASTSGVLWRRGPLDDAADVDASLDLLDGVRGLLDEADELAREAAGVNGERVAPMEQRCPACGNRSLQLHYDGDDRSRWHVRCISAACRCTGAGCGCRQQVRYPKRPHAWAAGELDGPYGLWQAIASARGPAHRVRSTAAGHGGWAERKTAPPR